MTSTSIERFLENEEATARLGEDIAQALKPGDVIALEGDLGAGKTTLARSIVRAVAGDADMDVPSPTFTLLQVYDGPLTIHHFDLYRLSTPDELVELGFDEALERGAALVEWPDRAGNALPPETVHVTLTHQGDGRLATLTGTGKAWARMARSLAMRDFLARSGWGAAKRRHLTGDASARSYEIVEKAGEANRILMNSPPLVLGPPVKHSKAYAEIAHTARDVTAFVGVDLALAKAGVSVPAIHAQDLDGGFLLIEHLGSEGVLDAAGAPIAARYAAAAELLAALHTKPWTAHLPVAPGVWHDVPPFDRDAMLIEVELLLEWYVPWATGKPADAALRRDFEAAWDRLIARAGQAETGLVQRDYHSPNLIWRADRQGHDRLGIIDFQDALIGPVAYDVASLAMDARVTVSPEVEAATVAAYVAARKVAGQAGGDRTFVGTPTPNPSPQGGGGHGHASAKSPSPLWGGVRGGGQPSQPAHFDEAAFAEAYAIMAAQRNSKILGIFVRLDRRDGKPHYLRHLPRIRSYLNRAFRHPALAELAALYGRYGLLDEVNA